MPELPLSKKEVESFDFGECGNNLCEDCLNHIENLEETIFILLDMIGKIGLKKLAEKETHIG